MEKKRSAFFTPRGDGMILAWHGEARAEHTDMLEMMITERWFSVVRFSLGTAELELCILACSRVSSDRFELAA